MQPTEPAPDITSILNKISSGDGQAVDELLPLVYEELRRQAALQMARERQDHTLQATALVHDAYIRLIGSQSEPNFESQGHFFLRRPMPCAASWSITPAPRGG